MEAIAQQVDEIYQRRVHRARQMDPLEKLWDGSRLFDGVLSRMRAGIRAQLGSDNDQLVGTELRRRLALLQKIHDKA